MVFESCLLAVTVLLNCLEKYVESDALPRTTSCRAALELDADWEALPQLLWDLILVESASFIDDLVKFPIEAAGVSVSESASTRGDSLISEDSDIPVSELVICGYVSLLLYALGGGGGGVPQGRWGTLPPPERSSVNQKHPADLLALLPPSLVAMKDLRVRAECCSFEDALGSWWLPYRLLAAFIALQGQVQHPNETAVAPLDLTGMSFFQTGELFADSLCDVLSAIRDLERLGGRGRHAGVQSMTPVDSIDDDVATSGSQRANRTVRFRDVDNLPSVERVHDPSIDISSARSSTPGISLSKQSWGARRRFTNKEGTYRSHESLNKDRSPPYALSQVSPEIRMEHS